MLESSAFKKYLSKFAHVLHYTGLFQDLSLLHANFTQRQIKTVFKEAFWTIMNFYNQKIYINNAITCSSLAYDYIMQSFILQKVPTYTWKDARFCKICIEK